MTYKIAICDDSKPDSELAAALTHRWTQYVNTQIHIDIFCQTKAANITSCGMHKRSIMNSRVRPSYKQKDECYSLAFSFMTVN